TFKYVQESHLDCWDAVPSPPQSPSKITVLSEIRQSTAAPPAAVPRPKAANLRHLVSSIPTLVFKTGKNPEMESESSIWSRNTHPQTPPFCTNGAAPALFGRR